MCKQRFLFILFLCLAIPGMVQAQGQPQQSVIATEDEKVIAVMEILELMEMVNEIALLKDMEYLMEEDPNEPQK
jgi:hypothetical protein